MDMYLICTRIEILVYMWMRCDNDAKNDIVIGSLLPGVQASFWLHRTGSVLSAAHTFMSLLLEFLNIHGPPFQSQDGPYLAFRPTLLLLI